MMIQPSKHIQVAPYSAFPPKGGGQHQDPWLDESPWIERFSNQICDGKALTN